MKILGLHFGHDAAVALVEDGRLAGVLERERTTRRKHALGLRADDVLRLLDDAGTRVDEIDYCTVTSTQHVELAFFAPEEFRVAYEPHRSETLGSWIYEKMPERRKDFLATQRCPLQEVLRTGDHLYASFMTDDDRSQFVGAPKAGNIEDFVWVDEWNGVRRLDELAAADLSAVFRSDATRLGFHYPVTVTLFGRRIAGCLMSHHFAHAAYSFYQSGLDEAAVLSHDGNVPVRYLNGMFYYGSGERLWAVAPHYLAMGLLYDQVAMNMGFVHGGPGKLMGLSSYGKPRFWDRAFCGNLYDVDGFDGDHAVARPWLEHCLGAARQQGDDLTAFGDVRRATDPLNVDIAASTQRLFEETLLVSVETLSRLLESSGRATQRLCLAGGTALNCPANTRVSQESPFTTVCVPPGCGDSGLAAGSALALYHNILGHPRCRPASGPDVYVGLTASGRDELPAVLPADDVRLDCRLLPDPARDAAESLVKNLVVGWFEGRSELGPRALGHRSILANPLYRENWERVNRIKGREWWRPFAPIVLEEEAAAWFEGAPLPSPYMLFTARVRSGRIPAVTHVDGSARLQTVSSEAGLIYDVVREFGRMTGVPVLLNTSFNGPGEPIVETAEDAIRFLLRSGLDAVYLNHRRYTLRKAAVGRPGMPAAARGSAIAG